MDPQPVEMQELTAQLIEVDPFIITSWNDEAIRASHIKRLRAEAQALTAELAGGPIVLLKKQNSLAESRLLLVRLVSAIMEPQSIIFMDQLY